MAIALESGTEHQPRARVALTAALVIALLVYLYV